MDTSKLYDVDFLLWTEQQARELRALGGSNSLDVVHLAEEIEDSGKRDLREVKSLVRQIFLHVLKLAADPGNRAARHWASEVVGFQQQLQDGFTPSMEQRLDLDQIWADAVRRFAAGPRPKNSDGLITLLRMSGGHPFSLPELVTEAFDLQDMVAAVDKLSLGSSARGDAG